MPRSSTKSSQSTPVVITPKKISVTQPSIHTPSAVAPSFGQIIKEGFGFGLGSSMARHAVDSVMSAFNKGDKKEHTQDACYAERKYYESCMLTDKQDSNCSHAFAGYQQCLEVEK
jgi:hypothetical protein